MSDDEQVPAQGCGRSCNCPSYREHVLSVGFAASAMPSRHPDAADKKQMVAGWNVDHDAYRRLVKNGVQPKGIDGAATIEKHANHVAEVEHGIGAPKELHAA